MWQDGVCLRYALNLLIEEHMTFRAMVYAKFALKLCPNCYSVTMREHLQARKAEREDARAERKAESKAQRKYCYHN